MDDPSTGPNMSPSEKEIGSKENIEQNLDSAQDERIEQAGRVGVEAAKPSSGEFPQTVPPVQEKAPQVPDTDVSLEKKSQEPSVVLNQPAKAEIISSLEKDIQDIKKSDKDNVSKTLERAVENLERAKINYQEVRKDLESLKKD